MDMPKCPTCGSDMVLRQAHKGKFAGKMFYGCSKYPKCKSIVNLEDDTEEENPVLNNSGSNNTENNHYIPTQIIAKPYYRGFNVTFCQSVSIPYEILQMINNEDIIINDFKKYSQYRLDYNINNTALHNSSMKDIFSLIKKILTRGTITISSKNLEKELETIFMISDYKDFNYDCYFAHKTVSEERNIDFDNSAYEEKFYYETLKKFFGDYYNSFVIPQASFESLIDSDKISNSIEQRRVDFLLTLNNESYVIELDGEEHIIHRDRRCNIEDNALRKEGYNVIRIQNQKDFYNALSTHIGHIDIPKYTARNLSNTEKLIVSLKMSHQIMIALIEALLSGYDYNNNKIYLNFSSNFINSDTKLKICNAIQNEFNDLLLHVSNLFNLHESTLRFEFIPYENNSDGIIISFNDKCIDKPNNIVISDIMINKIIANSYLSSSLKYYDNPNEENLEYFLDYIFRKEKFREGQYETISRGLQGKDTLVLLPTGAGKSIAFQLTSLLLNGVTLVIDPIIALINDQIENLNRIGIDRIAGITSLISNRKMRERTMKAFSMGDYIITFISPERLQTKDFRTAINGLTTITPIPLVAIDEAHCVSEWGHDFRTSYLNIGRISRVYCGIGRNKPCLIGLTGTASNSVLRDVQRELDIKDFNAVITPKTFDRKELSYDDFECTSQEKVSILRNLLERYFPEKFNTNINSFYSQNKEATKCGLIFCPHVNGDYGVKNVADSITKTFNLPVRIYSGEKPKYFSSYNWDNEKSAAARDFKNNKFNLLITTKAFGMGIDKPNINYTVHYGLPNSIESFYQEAGRAGRNGKFSKCVLLVSNDNSKRSNTLLDPKNSVDRLRSVMDNEVSFENADDISRSLFFHLEAFRGIEVEIDSIKAILNLLGNLDTPREVIIKANKNLSRKIIEKALYRLIVLGPVTDYTIDYSSDEFTVDYQKIDKDEIIDRYALYVAGYNKTRINKETEKLQEIFDLPYKDFIIGSSKVLISFIYDTIEKGKRRGIAEVLNLAESALSSGNHDEVIRNRILRYLETSYSEEIEKILNVDELKLDLIKDFIDGYETLDGRIIGGLRSPKDAEEIRGQVSRYLESNPDHPGLLILRAISELFCNDYNKSVVLSTLDAAIKYANEQVGYSIHNTEFYKMVAWSVVKIGEKDIEIYNELIEELLDRFNDLEFAKQMMQFASEELKMVEIPFKYIMQKNCHRINHILRG